MQLSINDIVRVIKVRSLAYGRKGVITSISGPRKRRRAIIRFVDVPVLTQSELNDPTGLVCEFDLDDLEATGQNLFEYHLMGESQCS